MSEPELILLADHADARLAAAFLAACAEYHRDREAAAALARVSAALALALELEDFLGSVSA